MEQHTATATTEGDTERELYRINIANTAKERESNKEKNNFRLALNRIDWNKGKCHRKGM
jgi:hypothetical protein